MGTKWEQSGNKNPKVGQEWEQSGNKVGTRTLKWDKNEQSGNKVGTRTLKWDKNGNKFSCRCARFPLLVLLMILNHLKATCTWDLFCKACRSVGPTVFISCFVAHSFVSQCRWVCSTYSGGCLYVPPTAFTGLPLALHSFVSECRWVCPAKFLWRFFLPSTAFAFLPLVSQPLVCQCRWGPVNFPWKFSCALNCLYLIYLSPLAHRFDLSPSGLQLSSFVSHFYGIHLISFVRIWADSQVQALGLSRIRDPEVVSSLRARSVSDDFGWLLLVYWF